MSFEAQEAIQELKSSGGDNEALILRCDQKNGSVVADHSILSDVTPEKLGEELPDGSPRFVVYRYALKIDASYTQPTLLLIFYNPLSVSVELKRTYQRSKSAVLQAVEGAKEVEINDPEHFTTDWIHDRVIGVTGKAKKFSS